MSQEVKIINLKDLVLWTENPRDPFDENACDQEIADKAFDDTQGKWSLKKLAKEMGEFYDFSELPTVVYHDEKPIVYDGNRRIILGKIKHDLVAIKNNNIVKIPEFPIEIPCNVCSRDVALKNVYRKHSDTGSWHPLERDIFLHKYMNEPKSLFLLIDEATGIIRDNPFMNQRFVKEEIFNEESLNSLGLKIKNGTFFSKHDKEATLTILHDLVAKIGKKDITTRKNRGKVKEVLDPTSQQIIDINKNNTPKKLDVSSEEIKKGNNIQKRPVQSRRVKSKKDEFFGGTLYLKIGNVSNLYRDIVDLYSFYVKNKNTLSHLFPSLIRMALRLLCETASSDKGYNKFDVYVKNYFKTAKDKLDKDSKTTLSTQNVTENSITQLLNTGAHSYSSSSNFEQTLAISIIVGGMLSESHGNKEDE